MKRTTQIIFFGLALFISSVALAGQGHGRHDQRGYHGDQRHHAQRYDRHHDRRHHGRRHVARYAGHAPRHLHHGRYCNVWHPHGYVAPRVRYGYGDPGLVIVYRQGAGLYITGGH